MSIAITLVQTIGLAHLAQPLLTPYLARRLDFRAHLRRLPPLTRESMVNAAGASVFLPTALGLLLAAHADAALEPGPSRQLGAMLGAFWSVRLARQFVLGRYWPAPARGLHWLLVSLLTLKGPVLILVLVGAWAQSSVQTYPPCSQRVFPW